MVKGRGVYTGPPESLAVGDVVGGGEAVWWNESNTQLD